MLVFGSVTVPYARLVLHPSGQTALPPIPDEGVELPALSNDRVTTLSRGIPPDNMLIEVEALRAGRIAFILGRRGIRYNAEVSRVTGIDQLGQNTVPFRAASKFAGLAVGQSDLVSFQRLCSFEYLQRYFYHVLRHQTIQIGDGAPLNPDGAVLNAEQASKFAKQLPPAVRWPKARVVLQAPDQTVTNINAKELAKALGVDKPEPPAEMADSGVFIADEGPFLRGKSIETQVLRSQRRIHDAAVGDEVAFHVLAQRLAEAGLLDWTPVRRIPLPGLLCAPFDGGCRATCVRCVFVSCRMAWSTRSSPRATRCSTSSSTRATENCTTLPSVVRTRQRRGSTRIGCACCRSTKYSF